MNNAAEVRDIEVLPPEGKKLKLFSEFDKQMSELRKNNNVVFDLSEEKGMEEAKAHVRGVKKVRTALEKSRKAAKANALAYGRAVDGQAKEIEGQIDELILVHEVPIQEVEQAELDRINAHEEVISGLIELIALPTDGVPRASDEIEAILYGAKSIYIGPDLEEFEEEARELQSRVLAELSGYLEKTQRQEEKDAKLKRLEKEQAVYEQESLEREAALRRAVDLAAKAVRDLKEEEELSAQREINTAAAIENAATQAREDLLEELEAERKEKEDRIALIEAAEEAEKLRIANDEAEQKARLERVQIAENETMKALTEFFKVEIIAGADEAASTFLTTIRAGEIPNLFFWEPPSCIGLSTVDKETF